MMVQPPVLSLLVRLAVCMLQCLSWQMHGLSRIAARPCQNLLAVNDEALHTCIATVAIDMPMHRHFSFGMCCQSLESGPMPSGQKRARLAGAASIVGAETLEEQMQRSCDV